MGRADCGLRGDILPLVAMRVFLGESHGSIDV